jgi:trk system potassium uptake protein TrkH
MGTFNMTLDAPAPARRVGSGSLEIGLTFAAIVVIASVLLSLSFTNAGPTASPLEGVFTSVSAISGTGLVVFDTQAQFTFAGEAVILIVIQVGGLGYMLGVSVILWAIGGRLGVRDSHMLRLYYGLPTLGEAARFIRNLALYAFACEAAGAIVLWFGFTAAGVDGDTAVWWAVFHSVSSFNEAGFNLTGADLLPFASEPLVLAPSGVLAVLGAVGAIPVLLLLQTRGRMLPLDSRVILGGTALLLLLGWAFIGIAEWTNGETIGSVALTDRPLLAAEQSAMWATGFSAIPTSELHDSTKFFLVGMMFVGGAAGSAAAGVKIGTFLLLLAVIFATLRGREAVTMLGREVPFMVARQAMVIALGLVAFIFALTVFLLTVSDDAAIDVMFEAVSATANVGWTPLDTASWGAAGRVALIVGMLVGRFAPLLLVLEMTRKRGQSPLRYPSEGVRLG